MKPCSVKKEFKMPNVYDCVKAAEKGLCGDYDTYAETIAAMSDNVKVKAFRNKDADSIKNILISGSKTIKEYIRDTFYNGDISLNDIKLVPGSTNNKDGADVNHTMKNGETVTVEVKFGSETTKNSGEEVFEKIFGTKAFKNALSCEKRESWRKQIFNDNNEKKQYDRLRSVLNEAIDEFNDSQAKKNYILSNDERKYMESEIINASGNGDQLKQYDHYVKFVLKRKKFQLSSRISTGMGSWIVKPVKKLDKNSPAVRATVFVINDDTKIQIKFVINWKNNFESEDGSVFAAKLGLGSFNWNIWVTKKPTDAN